MFNNQGFNDFNYNTGGQSWSSTSNKYPTYPPSGNVIRVTSLEEAIMRTTQRGSEMVYFHQDKNVFYLVRLDMNDRKTWQEFPYTVPNQDNVMPATRADIQTLITRIEALEAKFGTEVNADAQPVG